MDTPRFPTSYKAILPLIALIAVLTVCMPRTGEFEYHYHKGASWNYQTLVAPFNFPILKTAEQLNAEKQKHSTTLVPYYTYSSDVSDEVIAHLGSQLAGSPELSECVVSIAKACYAIGVIPDLLEDESGRNVVFVQKDKRAAKTPVQELFTASGVRSRIHTAAMSSFPDADIDSIFQASGVLTCIVPNLIFDKQTTELIHQQSSDFVSPTLGVFKAGDVIVSYGEVITSDIEQILDSYKAEFKQNVGYNGPQACLWLGNFLISVILSGLVFFMIIFIRPKTMDNYRELVFVLSVFLLSAVCSFIASKFDTSVILLFPFPVIALYYMAFFRKKFVLPLYAMALIPIMIVAPYGIMMYIIFLVGGMAAVYAFSYFYRGWLQFISALLIFVSMTLAMLAFNLVEGTFPLITLNNLIHLFLSSLFCILAYPLVYLFEIIFGLVSASRLVDLADTSQPLLRLLAEKAPGTFQHSLEVMNMADACARAIDADVPLIRAGALYHDVGKTENPPCYIENQVSGVNYHDGLTAKESSAEIVGHVSAGISLAEKYGLPKNVRRFIESHHGTSTTGYFFNKFVNDGGNPDEIKDFSYPGPNPSTKEEVILMMCDTAEASSRTLKDYSYESVSKLVEDIYKSKYKEGQFDDAAVTLSELEVIKNTIKTHIVQMHHGRIAYPKRKK